MSPRASPEAGTLTLKATITDDLGNQRLDKALVAIFANHVPTLSRARLQNLIAGNHVTRDGKAITDSSRKVKVNEVYQVQIPPPEPAEPRAQKMPLTIVYEDKDLLVIDKPVGMVVHPAPGNRDHTLVNALLAHCGKSLSGIGGVARPGIVHRLDKDTTGLIVVAKNDLAHQALSKQFSDRSLSRTYQAIVWDVPVPSAGAIEAPIGRHLRDRKKMAVIGKGKYALTRYTVLETFEIQDLGFRILDKKKEKRVFSRMPNPEYQMLSFIECKLETGRTHQIRVHLAHYKHPVVGDLVYGKAKATKTKGVMAKLHEFPRQALHAAALRFIHPRTGKLMKFKSPLPKDMASLLRLLRAQTQ